MKKYLPELLIGVITLALVTFAPLPIWDDGTQFELLSRSILRGEYALEPGVPSMYREPGYPLMRAMVYFVGGTPAVVLFVQALLAIGTALLWRRVWERIKPGTGWIGAWGTFIAYGYWLFARQHAYEVLIGFLLALGTLVFLRFAYDRKPGFAALSGLIFGALATTRGVFLFLFIPMIAFVLWYARGEFKDVAKRKVLLVGSLLFIVSSIALPAAWMTRNSLVLNSGGIASRPGLVLHARALKTEASWGQYGASLLGTFTGDAILKAVAPGLRPIDRQHTAQLDIERERIARELGTESTDMRVDDAMMEQAKEMIFRSPESFAKYAAWTLIDDIRLVSVPSFSTPWGTMEPMFLHLDRLGAKHVLFLLIAAIMNLIWLIGGVAGCYLGWKYFRERFVIAVPYVYLLAIHSPLDNVVRFSAAIQPIIGGFVVFSLALFVQSRWPKLSRRVFPAIEVK